MKINEVVSKINEVQARTLYHVTSKKELKSILSKNVLEARTIQHINGKEVSGVSTTRDLSVARRIARGKQFPVKGTGKLNETVIIVIDAEKLAQNKKIIPVDYFTTHPDQITKDQKFSQSYIDRQRRQGNRNEAEEFVIGSINNIKNFIVDILDKEGKPFAGELNKPALEESKSADLYHALLDYQLAKVLSKNTLEARTKQYIDGKPVYGVSLTRNLNFAKSWIGWGSQIAEWQRGCGLILVLDQNKLSHNYKIAPIDYFSTHKDDVPDETPEFKRRQGSFAESEEFVIGPIKNLKSFIKAILISSTSAKRLKERLAELEDKIKRYGKEVALNHELDHDQYEFLIDLFKNPKLIIGK